MVLLTSVLTEMISFSDVAGLQSHSGYLSDDDSEPWFTGLQLEAPRDDSRDETAWSLPSDYRGTVQCGTQRYEVLRQC